MSPQGPTEFPRSGEETVSPPGAGAFDFAAGRQLGKYVVIRRIGQGGMGVVYEAQDPLLQRHVAIKVLPVQDFDPEALERLLQEARAIARLNHPHVVGIHEIDRHDQGYYLVMELVPGGSALDRLTSSGPIPWHEATGMIAGACRGLMAAHAAGLIHRDIKPGNILLTATGEAKLADFGLAKAFGAGSRTITKTGSIVGTPNYMSPEQCRGEKLDDRSDLYSLGVTYYALLTGESPFQDAGEPMQIMYAHCMRPMPDPRKLQPDIPAPCVELLNRMLAKEPSQRPSSSKVLLEELEALLEIGEVTTTRLSPVPTVTFHWRHYALAMGVVAAVVLIGLILNFGSNRGPDALLQAKPSPADSAAGVAPTVAASNAPSKLVSELLPEVPLVAGGEVQGVAFSEDDRHLAWVSGQANEVRCLNLATGQHPIIDSSADRFYCVAFDTTGTELVCGDGSNKLRRWDIETGKSLSPLEISQGAADAIAFSPDGKLLAAGLQPYQSDGAALQVWSLADGNEDLKWPKLTGKVYGLAFSRDSTTLATVGSDSTLRLWDVAKKQPRREYLLQDVLEAVAFSPDRHYLAVAFAGQVSRGLLWDLRTPEAEPIPLNGPQKAIGAIAFTPDSQAVVCSAADGVWFWDVKTGKSYDKPLANPNGSLMLGLAFSHDGSVLVTGNHAGRLQVWHRKSWPNPVGRTRE